MTNCTECKRSAFAKPNSSLKCEECESCIHIGCLAENSVSHLKGDNFFRYICRRCEDDVIVERLPLMWLTIVHLALYNLCIEGNGRQGYFRFRDICTFIDQNWSMLAPDKGRTANWKSTTAGILSTNSPRVFLSGQRECNLPGWWTLGEISPPQLKSNQSKAKIKSKPQLKRKREEETEKSPLTNGLAAADTPAKRCCNEAFVCVKEEADNEQEGVLHSPAVDISDVKVKVEEQSEEDATHNEYERLTTTMSAIFNADMDEMESIVKEETESVLSLDSVWSSGYPSRTLAEDVTPSLVSAPAAQPCKHVTEEMKTAVEGRVSPMEQKKTTNRKMIAPSADSSLQKSCIQMRLLSIEEEEDIVKRLNKNLDDLNPRMRRLHRKLKLRLLKRRIGLPLFNIDEKLFSWIKRVLPINVKLKSDIVVERENNANRAMSIDPPSAKQGLSHPALCDVSVLDRFKSASPLSRHQLLSVSRYSTFMSKLTGSGNDLFTSTIISPYTSRILKPYIRRDTESIPHRVRLLNDIHIKGNSRCLPDITRVPYQRGSIDYCYVQPLHIPIVNAMCSEFFWPGIDLSECLQYPDFSCVVMYKRLVIGCGFMVPDVKYNEAYISFLLVHPNWQRCGIGSFLLYHLIQTCMGKDVTLHVSADNTSMLLYQKFGFKTEGFMLNFYDKYLPESSRDCRHAFFLRLQR